MLCHCFQMLFAISSIYYLTSVGQCVSCIHWENKLTNMWCNGTRAVNRGFEAMSGQTKDHKIGICCFSAKHAALRIKNKDWLARNQDNGSDYNPLWRSWCMTYEYWNSGNDVSNCSVGDVHEHGISLQDFKHPMIFWRSIEESCTFQKIYAIGKPG